MAIEHDRPMRKNERCHRCHWAPLMLVCRQWRALGVSTPSLWQLIEVGDNLDWVELALARSGSMPIRLLFTDKLPGTQALSFLTPHTHRIQQLIYPIASSYERMSRLRPLFDATMPILHEVEITNAAVQPPVALCALESARLPMLRTLRLSSISATLPESVLSKLHCLSLDGNVFHLKLISLQEFLGILEACVELKELRLYRVVRHLGFLAKLAQPLTLPKLRKLVLWDHSWLTSIFLANLHLSPDVTLRVCLPWQGGLSHALYTEGLDSLLPTDRSGLPILRSVTSAVIDCWHDFDVAIKARTRDAKVTLKISGSMRDPGTFYLTEAQEQFRVLFSGAPLEHLELAGDLGLVFDIRHHLRFFAEFPALQSLKLTGCGTPNTLLRALGHSHPYVPPTVPYWLSTHSHHRSSEPLVCPKLRSLTLQYANW